MSAAVEILLIEDNPFDVKLALHALKRQNITNAVHVARDGAEALEFLSIIEGPMNQKSIPNLVLLDLKLPKLDGLEVLEQIRANPRFATAKADGQRYSFSDCSRRDWRRPCHSCHEGRRGG